MRDMCPICGKLGKAVIYLPKYPETERYTKWERNPKLKGFADQTFMFCPSCAHGWLAEQYAVDYAGKEYLTESGKSAGAYKCLRNLFSFVSSICELKTPYNYYQCVDIGGNDGTFLSFFFDYDMQLVNIDPNASGDLMRVMPYKAFIEDADLSCNLGGDSGGSGSIIVSSHTIEHMADPSILFKKVSEVMRDDDIFFLQMPCLECMVMDMRYDQICHQHLHYFTLDSVSLLAKQYGLKIVKQEKDGSHFGTMRLALVKGEQTAQSRKDVTIGEIDHTYLRFQRYYRALEDNISNRFINGIGYGAGHMTPILAYYLPIVNFLRLIVDEDKTKNGKRFTNMFPEIVCSEPDNFEQVLITAISTKQAARDIFCKIVKRGVNNIVLPVIMT